MKTLLKFLRTLVWIITIPFLVFIALESSLYYIVKWLSEFLFEPYDERIARKKAEAQKKQEEKEEKEKKEEKVEADIMLKK